jgi:hypothetical protein
MSSISHGQPPFEWISENEILYQHMVPVDWKESQYVLKCANIKDKTTTEWLTKKLPLTLDGGKISYDWLMGEIYFQDFLVDIKNKTLLPKKDIFSINQNNQRTEISFNGEPIFNRDSNVSVVPCISHSKKNFACLIRPNKNGKNAIYIKANDIKEPLVISQDGLYTDVIAWIENTGKDN